ncbi:MtrAB system accessory lipoprotein LpqB [Fodinicola feengrottensis]|uniref:MtrAB system accessory lipoprotein LpqB n=1 Tax=Fodinicola feengrottensis TaxID=435914 RepID=A0ABN2GEY5_9ACTN
MVAAVLVLTACGVPDSGHPVVLRQIAPGGADQPDPSNVHSEPSAPRKDGTAVQSVEGFLLALATTPENSYAAAKNFLSPANQRWAPTGPLRVFSQTAVASVGKPDSGQVRITGSQVGLLNADGTFTPQPATVDVTVQLNRADGLWRIDNPPADVLFRSDFFSQSYVPVPLYFLDPTGQRLVPDIRYLDASTSLSDRWTAAMRLLIAGPSPWLTGAVKTAIPASTRLRGNVIQEDQDVAVDVSSDAALTPQNLVAGMVAQFVWSMKGAVGGVAGGSVQLLVDGRQVTSIGTGATVKQIQNQYDPSAATAHLDPFRIVGGVVQKVLDAPDAPDVPSAVSAATGVRSAAMSIDGGAVAMVRSAAGGRQTLFTGPSAGPLRPVLTAGTVSAPTWEPDHSGALAAVDGREIGYAPMDHPVITAGAPGLAAILGKSGRLVAVRLAPDGVHLALVVSDGSVGQVLVGVFQAGTFSAAVTSLRVISSKLTGATDVAWTGDNALLTIGRRGEVVQNEIVADGSGEQITLAVGLHDVPTQIAAVPNRTLVTSGGYVYQSFQRGWASPDNSHLIPGTGVFYPG